MFRRLEQADNYQDERQHRTSSRSYHTLYVSLMPDAHEYRARYARASAACATCALERTCSWRNWHIMGILVPERRAILSKYGRIRERHNALECDTHSRGSQDRGWQDSRRGPIRRREVSTPRSYSSPEAYSLARNQQAESVARTKSSERGTPDLRMPSPTSFSLP